VNTLTVLTDPVPAGSLVERLRRTARAVREGVDTRPAFARSPYRGHFAVTRSLVEGLAKIGVPAAYNPSTAADLGRVVGVLSSARALRQAIEWKRAGRIDRLLAGPNLVNFPSDEEGLVASPEVDLCVTPSPLVRAMYEEDCPALAGRCVTWPAGVDTDYWRPGSQGRRGVLIYEKPTRWPLESSAPYAAVLRTKGREVTTIRYGQYMPDDYRRLLQKSALMVGFASTESHGIAWAEAWAADVPTLIWRQDTITFEHPGLGVRVYPTSTAPYLTPHTGAFFTDLPSFEQAVDTWESAATAYAPRAWVLSNMSDEASARKYLALAGVGA